MLLARQSAWSNDGTRAPMDMSLTILDAPRSKCMIETPAQAPAEQPEENLKTTRGPIYDSAALGFLPYWYPAILSRQLGKKPKAVKLLGEDLVFLRANGKPYALHDRCVHRGVRLSYGTCLSEGTLTCPYHG